MGIFGGTSAYANAINASGQIAGEVYDARGGYHAFVTEGAGRVARVLKGLGVNSVAYALNDRGEAVGGALYDDLNAQAFLYTGGKMENLGALSDTDAAFGEGINAGGNVVGTSAQGGPPFNRRAWVYLGGPLHDLNDCLEPGMAKRWTVTEAHGINEVGQIVGTATNATGQSRAVLLTPRR